MKKIGVSSFFLHPDPNRDTFWPKTIACFETQLCDFSSLHDCLAWPVIPFADKKKLDALFDQLDALVLQGGTDVDPNKYGETNIDPLRWKNDPIRDDFEILLIEKAMKKNIPILGICRGAQLLNVYFGGSLHQDVEGHRKKELYDTFTHPISWGADSIFSEIYKEKNGQAEVNSIHHQAIKILAPSLLPMAISHDQRVEAFIHQDKDKKILGIQWHPEFYSPELQAEKLWSWFLR